MFKWKLIFSERSKKILFKLNFIFLFMIPCPYTLMSSPSYPMRWPLISYEMNPHLVWTLMCYHTVQQKPSYQMNPHIIWHEPSYHMRYSLIFFSIKIPTKMKVPLIPYEMTPHIIWDEPSYGMNPQKPSYQMTPHIIPDDPSYHAPQPKPLTIP